MSDDHTQTPHSDAPQAGDRAPDVAFIITTYNRPDFLPQAIESVLHQRTDQRVELVIVDDGSTTNTKLVVNPYVLKYRDPRGKVFVRYLYKENGGAAAARNTGIADTTAPYIAFLDDDDLCEPGRIQAQVEAMRRDGAVGLVHTSFRYVDVNGEFCDDGPQRVDNPCVGDCVDVLLNELLVITSTIMVRRTFLEQAAAAEPHGLPFDPKWIRSQDYDLVLRMARISRFAYVPEPMLRYRFHDGNNAMSKDNIKTAFGYHCRVQIDFVQRYGDEVGVDEDEAKRRVANFLFNRSEAHFWQRKFDICRQLCDLAKELGVHDKRFAFLEEKSSRPAWLYKAKDQIDRLRS